MVLKKTLTLTALAIACGLVACSEQPTSIDDETVEAPVLRSSAAPELRDIPPVPFWARTPPICCFDGYAVIYFYVADPSVIPPDFNVLTFFDPRAVALPAEEWAVEGFAIRDLPPPFAPKKTLFRGKGAVPFWFVTEGQLAAAAADGFINMPELESLDPIKGFANRFQEELHPTNSSATQSVLLTTAGGDLVSGGAFRFNLEIHINQNTGVATSNVKGSLKMD